MLKFQHKINEEWGDCMRLKKITFFLLILSSVLNIIFSNFLHQGVLGVGLAIVCILIAAITTGTKDKKNSVKEK
jgi:hypothetical protein